MTVKKVVKKKKKGLGRVSIGSGAQEQSSRRPQHVSKTPPCQHACPNHIDIRGVLTTIAQAQKKEKTREQTFTEAWNIFSDRTPFPSICGRVCPHPCEADCNRSFKDTSVAINNIERFVGDWALEQKLAYAKLADQSREQKIAVIGSGPAGMSCAYQLARRGYPVTVFEAFPEAGGMLRYGIPAYRLPREILDGEIKRILDLGVELKLTTRVGKDIPYEKIQDEYDAIFVGVGAHQGIRLGAPGEDAANVYEGTMFLRHANVGQFNDIPIGDKVAVIGGGDTAIDCARVALRMGAKDVTILYRRTRKEMPAIEEEIDGALEEGIKIEYLTAPIEVIRENGTAVAVRCRRMELGEPDESGRRRPVPIEGSDYDVPISALIAAISQKPEINGLGDITHGKGWFEVDEHFHTDSEKVYAGGDDITLGLVTTAIYQGRMAAYAIHQRFAGEAPPQEIFDKVINHDHMKLDYYESRERHDHHELPIAERLIDPDAEINQPIPEDDIVAECGRCMSCSLCFDCGQCWSFCQDGAIVKPLLPGDAYKFKLEFCKGCDKCAESCPCGYIEMV